MYKIKYIKMKRASVSNSQNKSDQALRADIVRNQLPQIMEGRATMAQEIEALRKDNPDKISSIGERMDNHLGHGKARKMLFIHEKHRIIDAGDGIWVKREHFAFTFCKNGNRRSSDAKRYEDASAGARWNYGATDSVMKDGELATTMHPFDGKLLVTKCDCKKIRADNDIKPNEQLATKDEFVLFMKIMKMMNSDYTLSSNTGTVTIVTDLEHRGTKSLFDAKSCSLKSLYNHEQYRDFEILAYWSQNGEWSSNEDVEPNMKIEPKNIHFGATPNTKTHVVYENPEADKIQILLDNAESPNGYKQKYKFDTTSWRLSKNQEQEEKNYFNSTYKRTGCVAVYRDGRNVVDREPLNFGVDWSKKDSRGKGIRLTITLPTSEDKVDEIDAADDDFTIGTNKRLDNPKYDSMNETLRKYLNEQMEKVDSKYAKEEKLKKEEIKNEYKKLISAISTLSPEDARSEIKKDKKRNKQYWDDGMIKKSNSKIHLLHLDYVRALEKHIDLKTQKNQSSSQQLDQEQDSNDEGSVGGEEERIVEEQISEEQISKEQISEEQISKEQISKEQISKENIIALKQYLKKEAKSLPKKYHETIMSLIQMQERSNNQE
jgi:hypothetical protein